MKLSRKLYQWQKPSSKNHDNCCIISIFRLQIQKGIWTC